VPANWRRCGLDRASLRVPRGPVFPIALPRLKNQGVGEAPTEGYVHQGRLQVSGESRLEVPGKNGCMLGLCPDRYRRRIMSAKTKTKQVIAGRDGEGRFAPGHSGNPSGRPRKCPAPVKDLSEQLAEALGQEITCEGADGKKRWITCQQLIVENLIAGLQHSKPREQIDLLLKLKAMGALPVPLDESTAGLRYLQQVIVDFMAGKYAEESPPPSGKRTSKPRGNPS
jgi:hypothetical protein